MGLMPHPERASEVILGRTDGLGIFQSLADTASVKLGLKPVPRAAAGAAR